MLSIARRVQRSHPCLQFIGLQLRSAHADGSSSRHQRRRSKFSPSSMLKKADDKSDWWVVDGEMHEIGENVPLRERFVIPRQNIPNKRRKQLREQFMRRTRLVLKESEHEPWCKRYMELYNEMRENWERLYWDEGYSKKLAQDHANYDSAEDDDEDFSPCRRSIPNADQMKHIFLMFWESDGVSKKCSGAFASVIWRKKCESCLKTRSTMLLKAQVEQGGTGRNRQGDNWEKVSLIRDRFEYDRERRMREKAFAPMNEANNIGMDYSTPKFQAFDTRRYISDSDNDSD